MSETNQIEQAVNELIRGAISNAEQAKEFMLGQAPEFVQQLLIWNAMKSAGLSVLALITLFCIAKIGIHAYKKLKDNNVDMEGWGLSGFIFLILAVAPVGLSLEILTNLTWLQIWIAPKVYLVEYAASLVK